MSDSCTVSVCVFKMLIVTTQNDNQSIYSKYIFSSKSKSWQIHRHVTSVRWHHKFKWIKPQDQFLLKHMPLACYLPIGKFWNCKNMFGHHADTQKCSRHFEDILVQWSMLMSNTHLNLWKHTLSCWSWFIKGHTLWYSTKYILT